MRPDCVDVENMPPVAINMPSIKGPNSCDQDISISGSPDRDGLTGQPIKEGTVIAVQTIAGRQVCVPVVLKVYASNFGRYAVVAQDNVICRECGYINLKNCTIKSSHKTRVNGLSSSTALSPLSPRRIIPNNQHSFEVISQKSEGQSMVFTVGTLSELEHWLSVLKEHENDANEVVSKVTVGSPVRRPLGQLSPMRVASPRLPKKQQVFLPALEEE